MKRAAVVIKNADQQYEGLRICVGLLLNGARVEMYVLQDEIDGQDEAYRDNLEFADEMNGRRYSNNPANVENYGFRYVTLAKMAGRLSQADVVIPL